MTIDLHKSAHPLHQASVPHPGILTASHFRQDYELHCYEPYIHGVHSRTFAYDASRVVWAGVKFRPGGLHAFCGWPMYELSDTCVPAREVFAAIDDGFRQKLTTMTDEDIVQSLETVLHSYAPRADSKLRHIATAMRTIASVDVEHVRDIVHLTGMSERTLQALFRERVGVSLQWTLARRRLITALGSSGHTTWTDIAATYGYSSQSHFIRAFKHATGISPSTYRKRIS